MIILDLMNEISWANSLIGAALNLVLEETCLKSNRGLKKVRMITHNTYLGLTLY